MLDNKHNSHFLAARANSFCSHGWDKNSRRHEENTNCQSDVTAVSKVWNLISWSYFSYSFAYHYFSFIPSQRCVLFEVALYLVKTGIHKCYSGASKRAGKWDQRHVLEEYLLTQPSQIVRGEIRSCPLFLKVQGYEESTPPKSCFKFCYRNFRPITRAAHYPHRSIFAIKGKNCQQITCTGR